MIKPDLPFLWKIYYANGSTFDSNDGSWKEKPGWGILAVVYFRPDSDDPKIGGRGWEIASGGDFYVRYADNTVISMDRDSLMDYIVNELGLIGVGRMVSWVEFQRVSRTANTEINQLKQGYSRRERQP